MNETEQPSWVVLGGVCRAGHPGADMQPGGGVSKPTLSPRQWGEVQTPPISKARVQQLYRAEKIPGARKVRYKAESGRWAYRIEIPADAVRIPGVLGRPKKQPEAKKAGKKVK